MMYDSSKVIFLHLTTKNQQKRQYYDIRRETTLQELTEKAKELYNVTQNLIEMMVELNNQNVLLTELSFEFFKTTVHINKIINIKQYDILNLTVIDPSQPQKESILNEVKISKQSLIPINDGAFTSDYSSFLADDFHQLVSFLKEIVILKADVQENQQDIYTQNLIQLAINSLKLPLENHFANHSEPQC